MGLYDDNPDRVTPGEPATVEAAPARLPRIRVTPAPSSGVTYSDNPDRPGADTGAAGTGREQSQQSWPEYFAEGASDFGRAAADYGTFGVEPRAKALAKAIYTGNPDYDALLAQEWQDIEKRRERSPIATFGGSVAGGVGAATGTAAAAPALTGRALAARAGGGPLARFLGFGAEGAVQGAAQGAGHTVTGEANDYINNALWGGGTGAVLSGTIGATLVPRSSLTARPAVRPSEEALHQMSERGYGIFSRLPIEYAGGHFRPSLQNFIPQMENATGALPTTAQKTYNILETLARGGYRPQGQATNVVTPMEIETARQQLNLIKPMRGSDDFAAAQAAKTFLNNYIQQAPQTPFAVASGAQHAATAGRVVQAARGDYAGLMRSLRLTSQEANAANAASGERTVGERLAAASDRMTKLNERGQMPGMRGYTEAERAALPEAVKPSRAEIAATFAGNIANKTFPWIGGAIGGGTGGVSGFAAGGVPGIVAGAGPGLAGGAVAGTALGKGAEALARGFSSAGIRNRWNEIAQQTRDRTPYGQYLQRTYGMTPGPGSPATTGTVGGAMPLLAAPTPDGRDALVPSLMQGFVY